MKIHTRKLLTIITESLLESTIIRDIERLGASGYTVMDVRGKGTHGVRNAGWEATGNIRIEVICNEEKAAAIVAHMQQHYYEDYAMSLFMTDVNVWRPEKF